MNEQLHPLTLGEILDRTAQMYRAQFLRFLGIAIIPTAVLLGFTALAVVAFAFVIHVNGRGTLSYAGGVAVLVFFGVLTAVGLPVCTGAMALSWAGLTDAAAKSFLGGTFTIRGAYGSVWKRRWRLLWLLTMDALFLGVIPGSAVFAIIVVDGLLATVASRSGQAALGILVGVVTFALIGALLVGVVWLLLRMCLGFAACVTEEASAWQSLKRSAVLSKGTKGRLSVVFLLGYALEVGLTMGFYIPVVIVVALVPGLQGAKHADAVSTVIMIAFYGLSFLVHALTRPVYGIALTLAYFDQRIRKEGFDIEWMMQHAGMVSAAVTDEKLAVHAEPSPWLTLPEEPAGGSGS